MDTQKVTQLFKGIAIFIIILCHSHQTFTLPGEINDILSLLQTGVQLFLILSSFGLCFSYQKKPVNWLKFMKQRFSKIAVLYWFAIGLATIYRCVYAFSMHNSILKAINPIGIITNVLFLHGFSPDNVINNQIVRGGWYMGTIAILYSVFPLLFRLYFKKGENWKTTRMYAFPIIVFAVTTVLHLILKRYIFFNSINKTVIQLAPFSLGFTLFELQKTNTLNKVKFPVFKGIFFAVLACLLYFSESVISFAYIFNIGIAFFYLLVSFLKNDILITAINSDKTPAIRFFNAFGKYSYAIYLTHSYIAFDFCYVFTTIMSRIYINDLLWFIVLQPIVFALSYCVGKCFYVVVSKISRSNKS